MAIQMIGDNVLIAAVPKEAKETVSDGGIILTSEPKKTASEPGVVIAVGPSAGMVQQGDTVYLSWDQSMPVKINGQEAVIVSAEYVKAIVS